MDYSMYSADSLPSLPLPPNTFTSTSTLNRYPHHHQNYNHYQYNQYNQSSQQQKQNINHVIFSSTTTNNNNNKISKKSSNLSKILSNDDDDYGKDRRQPFHKINTKRFKCDEDFERIDDDDVLRDTNGNPCCQDSGVTYMSSIDINNNNNSTESSPSKSSPITLNDSSNDDTQNNNTFSEQLPQQQILRQNKGLRHFSKQVCDKVELKGVTTYNEVADELAEDFAAQMQDIVDQKNIRRRVYDALNVLMAMDIIAKDKKEIRQKFELQELERQNRNLSKQVNDAKIAFQNKIAQHLHICNLVKRNKLNSYQYQSNNGKSKIYFPFKLIRCPQGTQIDIQSGQDGFLTFYPNKPTILNDVDILQCIGMDKISHDDMQSWINPEHLKWVIAKQAVDVEILHTYKKILSSLNIQDSTKFYDNEKANKNEAWNIVPNQISVYLNQFIS
ncbi:14078_t:CDS:2 [Entrophospora sp. SA101]|nr:15674_t:CDS:2 [Entrophospora sp. SA101]CAJ0754431.1 14078_t:CDS:2 [Entrophospora sp. SA101]